MRQSATARLLVMAFLTIALLVPVTWVFTIVRERASRRNEAVSEVSATWGGPQTFAGAVLTVPYTYTATDTGGRQQETTAYAHMLPAELHIDGQLEPQRRRRGIFDVIVYRAQFAVRGRFLHGPLDWVRTTPDRLDWTRSVLTVGLTDLRGLGRRGMLTWDGREMPFTTGGPPVGLFAGGVHATLAMQAAPQPGRDTAFSFTLVANGTCEVRFLPAAEETVVTLKSTWPHPSFMGAALPDRWEATGGGFQSHWQVADFGRPFPARWTSAESRGDQLIQGASKSAFGVDLIQPVDIYQQGERAVKYAVLFFVLTFLVFFLWEIVGTTLVHPVQYAFVGFALCLFYLLLVSLSEHAGFDLAYATAAAVTTLLIGAYSRPVLRGTRQAGSVVASLVALYGFLYLLLRLEDYALLAGAAGLFAVLALVMFVTRRMNWYELRLGPANGG